MDHPSMGLTMVAASVFSDELHVNERYNHRGGYHALHRVKGHDRCTMMYGPVASVILSDQSPRDARI